METKEIAQEVNQKAERGVAEIIIELAQEADQVITKAGQAARQEAEQEVGRILRQYEQTTKQIVLKIREETKAKAAEIADSVRDSIMLRIEKASTDAIAEAIAESSRKVEELVKKQQEIAEKEDEPVTIEAKVEVDSDTSQASNLARQEDTAEAEDKAKDTRRETELEPGGDTIELEQPIGDFDQWLSQ